MNLTINNIDLDTTNYRARDEAKREYSTAIKLTCTLMPENDNHYLDNPTELRSNVERWLRTHMHSLNTHTSRTPTVRLSYNEHRFDSGLDFTIEIKVFFARPSDIIREVPGNLKVTLADAFKHSVVWKDASSVDMSKLHTVLQRIRTIRSYPGLENAYQGLRDLGDADPDIMMFANNASYTPELCKFRVDFKFNGVGEDKPDHSFREMEGRFEVMSDRHVMFGIGADNEHIMNNIFVENYIGEGSVSTLNNLNGFIDHHRRRTEYLHGLALVREDLKEMVRIMEEEMGGFEKTLLAINHMVKKEVRKLRARDAA